MQGQIDRNFFLQLDDEALSRHCKLEFIRGSGPGGQKRNKSSSAVRVTLLGTVFSAEDCTERSQHRNRASALRKLKMLLALNLRQPPAPPPPPECALTSPAYPLFAARLLDALAACDYDHAGAARKIGVTPTAMIKKLFRDPDLWQFVNRERLARNRPPLKNG